MQGEGVLQAGAGCPEEVLALIPWYPDGPLSDRERGLVEAHAAGCAGCREEIASLLGELRGPEGLDVPPAEASLARVRSLIDAEESRRARPAPRLRALEGGRGAADTAAAPRPAAPRPAAQPVRSWGRRLALAAGLVAAAGLGFLASERLLGPERPADAVYRTATSPGAGRAGGPLLEIVPHDHTTLGELRRVLREVEGELVAGPSGSLGRYRVQLPAGADAGAVAARLRASEGGIASYAEAIP